MDFRKSVGLSPGWFLIWVAAAILPLSLLLGGHKDLRDFALGVAAGMATVAAVDTALRRPQVPR